MATSMSTANLSRETIIQREKSIIEMALVHHKMQYKKLFGVYPRVDEEHGRIARIEQTVCVLEDMLRRKEYSTLHTAIKNRPELSQALDTIDLVKREYAIRLFYAAYEEKNYRIALHTYDFILEWHSGSTKGNFTVPDDVSTKGNKLFKAFIDVRLNELTGMELRDILRKLGTFPISEDGLDRT